MIGYIVSLIPPILGAIAVFDFFLEKIWNKYQVFIRGSLLTWLLFTLLFAVEYFCYAEIKDSALNSGLKALMLCAFVVGFIRSTQSEKR